MDHDVLQFKLMQHEDRVHEFVSRHFHDILKATSSVDDLLQEIWFAAFRRAAELQEDVPNAFERWIITIARNKLTDALRHARAKCRSAPYATLRADESSFLTLADRVADKSPTPSRVMSARDSIRAVRTALEALPHDHRQVILLHHIEGRSHEEIARIMDRTTDAINGLMYRAMKKLRSEMGRASQYFSDAADTTRLSRPDLDLSSSS